MAHLSVSGSLVTAEDHLRPAKPWIVELAACEKLRDRLGTLPRAEIRQSCRRGQAPWYDHPNSVASVVRRDHLQIGDGNHGFGSSTVQRNNDRGHAGIACGFFHYLSKV